MTLEDHQITELNSFKGSKCLTYEEATGVESVEQGAGRG